MVTYEPAAGQHIETDAAWGLRHGVVAGIVAGLVFAAFEMMASALMMGPEAFFMPLRMIGAILLGEQALDPSYSLIMAGLAGVMVHMVLSIIYGGVFGAIVGAAPIRAGGPLVLLAALFGLALWLVNFYMIAPGAFPWFLQTNPFVQFLGHTFFFGAVLGLYMSWQAQQIANQVRYHP